MKIFRILVLILATIISVISIDISSVPIFVFIILGAFQIFGTKNHKTLNLVIKITILVLAALMFLANLVYVPQNSSLVLDVVFWATSFIAFAIKPRIKVNPEKKEKKTIQSKWWLIAWMVSLLIFSAALMLLILKVGTVENRPSGWVIIPLLISPVCFLISLSVWLILKLRKWAIIPFIVLVAMACFGIYSYEQAMSQEKEVCKTVFERESKLVNLSADFQRENTQLNADTTNVTWSPSQFSKVISDYKSLQKTNDDVLNLIKEELDIYSKYANQFMGFLNPPKDLDAKYKIIQDAQVAVDQSYKANMDFYQALVDMKPLSELQLLYNKVNEISDKKTEVGKNSNFDSMFSVQNEIYTMCSQL